MVSLSHQFDDLAGDSLGFVGFAGMDRGLNQGRPRGFSVSSDLGFHLRLNFDQVIGHAEDVLRAAMITSSVTTRQPG